MIKCMCRIKRNKHCDNDSYININNRPTCFIHTGHIYKKQITYIQYIFHSYKINKGFHIYKTLPNDIKHIIAFNMQENNLIRKYHYVVIENILARKISYLNKFTEHSYTWSFYHVDETLRHIIDAHNLIKMCTKYYSALQTTTVHERIAYYLRYANNILLENILLPDEIRDALWQVIDDYTEIVINGEFESLYANINTTYVD